MKTLVEQWGNTPPSQRTFERFEELVDEHDAVMAQMAEALRECRKFCFANHPRSMADSALSAHQLLGEQP